MGSANYWNYWALCSYGGSMIALAMVVLFSHATVLFAKTGSSEQRVVRSGKELYLAACAACHGADGSGAAQATTGLETPLPDFTDCSFSEREADSDWMAVVHNGGPARAFSEMMPAFSEALSNGEIQKIVSYLRSFCRDQAWPRGELNLPRPLVTEKAFPEDEAVLTTTVTAEGPGAVTNAFLYERRLGARSQIELNLPVSALHLENGGWRGGAGDLALGFKRTLFHSLGSGSIFSIGGEAALPTGKKATGIGKGYTTFEGYAAFGQILPLDGFFQFQGGIEAPKNSSRAAKETFWRAAVGRSFVQDRGFGRAWSPMIEVLGARDLKTGAKVEWDLLPQMQVTLSTRQHI
ncbi:MAG: cytochrome c, partial [Acidobacteriales bacterium]|nr:cytochrome c [Terriglobales bacterium]